jgi:hypothetical protein
MAQLYTQDSCALAAEVVTHKCTPPHTHTHVHMATVPLGVRYREGIFPFFPHSSADPRPGGHGEMTTTSAAFTVRRLHLDWPGHLWREGEEK